MFNRVKYTNKDGLNVQFAAFRFGGRGKKKKQYFSGSMPRCILILIVVMNNHASYEEESVEYSSTLSCHN